MNTILIKMDKKKIYGILFIGILIFLTFFISYKLFFNQGIVAWGDYPYYFPENHMTHLFTWSENYLGVSKAGAISDIYTKQFPFLLSLIGFNGHLISYLLYILPMLLSIIIVYLVTFKISKSILLSLFCSSFIILNNFVLEQLLFWPGYYFINIMGLIILIYLTFSIYKEGLNIKKCLLLIINSILIIHPLFFLIYLIYLILFFIFYIFSSKKIKMIYTPVLIFTIIFLVHSYWLIPFISDIFVQTPTQSYNGNLAAVFSGYQSIGTYVNLFNYANYPGLWSFILHQGFFQYLFYFSLIILILYIVFFKSKEDNKEKKFAIFLFYIYLIFFDLSLGPNSKITGTLWLFLFNNISIFGFLRSFTRFLIVPLISILFILPLCLKNRINKKTNILILIFIIFLIGTNLIFFTGNLRGNEGNMVIPSNYNLINSKYFTNNIKFNIIAYPNIPYEAYTWSSNEFDDENIRPHGVYFENNFYSKPIVKNLYALRLEENNNLSKRVLDFYYNFNFNNDLNKDIDFLNVKYIIIHKDQIDILNNKNVSFIKYYDYFNNGSEYILVEDNNYFSLFENIETNPTINSNNISFKNINPTKYKIYISNLSNSQNLSFLESYHKEWKLYLIKNPTDSWCNSIEFYNNTNTTECEHDRKFFEGDELSYLWKKPIFDNTHDIIFDYANSWTIDPQYIKDNFSKDYYTENPDGSINIELVMYFKPQSYFYIGLIISGITFILCILYLIYDFIKHRKAKKDLNPYNLLK